MDEAAFAMQTAGLTGRLRALKMDSEERARRYGFRGSPTVTVAGRDVDPSMSGDPGLAWG